ncbi:hypothetical protein, partial [uncultured Bacteroides sp.]|uniref:hypothetical protein n=1 Tax=uncultured Bacteroides sp. TaxID=162156 RepID=UPI0025917A3A
MEKFAQLSFHDFAIFADFPLHLQCRIFQKHRLFVHVSGIVKNQFLSMALLYYDRLLMGIDEL